MKLTFNRAGVERLLAHAKAASEHRSTFEQRPPIGPGLILVGDQGVYLMSNGLPMLKADDGENNFVVYADQINPETMQFDDWYEAKRAAFGGDDGAEPIPAASIEHSLVSGPGHPLGMELTPQNIGIMIFGQSPRRPKRAPKR